MPLKLNAIKFEENRELLRHNWILLLYRELRRVCTGGLLSQASSIGVDAMAFILVIIEVQ